MSKKTEDARQKALEALQNAYGQTQPTPDGAMCRLGRIDRAYQLKINANGNAAKYEAAIQAMQTETTGVFDLADRLMATYQRLCKLENIDANIDTPTCICRYCNGEFSGRMYQDDRERWERFIASIDATDQARG